MMNAVARPVIYRHFHRIAWLAVALTLCVVVFGAFVRLSDAGLSCPDWPTCYGRAAWPKAVAEAQRYVETSTVPEGLHAWIVEWAEEIRPGRGHAFNGVWLDGEYIVQIRMDVYGSPSVSVGSTEWLHSSDDEECPCQPCRTDRDEEAS